MLVPAYTMIEILRYLPFAGERGTLCQFFTLAADHVDVSSTVFAGMRAWALSTNWVLSALVLVFSLIPFAVDLVRLYLLDHAHPGI